MSSPPIGRGRAAAALLAACTTAGLVVTGLIAFASPAFATAAPTIASLSVAKGTTAGSTNVLITGTNFPDDISSTGGVKFGTTDATNVLWLSATQITATSPANSTDGAVVDVLVTTVGGTSAVTASDKFTYRTPITPSITANTLLNPIVSGKLPVTVDIPVANTADITTKKITATIGGAPAVPTWVSTTGTSSSDSSVLNLAVPTGIPANTAALVVIYHDGVAGPSSNASKYAAVITGMTVTSGTTTANPTGTVVITGKGLTGATAWKIGDQDFTGTATAGPCVPTSTALADTSWTCTGIPAAPQNSSSADILGPVAVSFTSATGPFAYTAAGAYTYTNLR
jgi:IPT/TIG domain